MSTNESNSTKGSITNPYTESEMNSMMDNDTWTGGYVIGLGYVSDEVTVLGSSSNTSDSEGSDSWGISDHMDSETDDYDTDIPEVETPGFIPNINGNTSNNSNGNTAEGEIIETIIITGGGSNNSKEQFPTPPNKQNEGPCVRVYSERIYKSEYSTLSKFTAIAYDNTGNKLSSTKLEGYFLERAIDYERATVSGSKTAILKGEYTIIPKEIWQEFDWYLNNVPGRAGIAIHSGNTYIQTEGCLLTGSNYTLNSNGTYSVSGSRKCLELLSELFRTYGYQNIKIIITENFN